MKNSPLTHTLLGIIALVLTACSTPYKQSVKAKTATSGKVNSNTSKSFVGYVGEKGTFEGDFYRFDYIPANSMLKNSPWRHFKDNKAPETTILLAGVPGFSYALNIMVKSNPEKLGLMEFAKKTYPKMEFTANDLNTICISTSLDSPIRLSRFMKTFITHCAKAGSDKVYELQISERSFTGKEIKPEYPNSMSVLTNSFEIK